MKDYGFEHAGLPGDRSHYLEHRTFGLMAGLALGGLFSEPWVMALGLAFYVCGWLADIWGKHMLLIGIVIPITAIVWFGIALIEQNIILPASILFSIICFMIILNGHRAPPTNPHADT